MDLLGDSFSLNWLAASWLIYILLLFRGIRHAQWERFRDNQFLHVFFGASVAAMLLWLVKGGVSPGLSFHILGVTALTLMFGWALALMAVSVVVVGTTWSGLGSWETVALNVLVMGAVPIYVTHWLLVSAQRRLPHNFFIYVLLNAFFAAGLSSVIGKCIGAALLVLAGAQSFDRVAYEFLPYLPLMFFSEAVVNGMLMTMLVALRPAWVETFDDDLYLRNK